MLRTWLHERAYFFFSIPTKNFFPSTSPPGISCPSSMFSRVGNKEVIAVFPSVEKGRQKRRARRMRGRGRRRRRSYGEEKGALFCGAFFSLTQFRHFASCLPSALSLSSFLPFLDACFLCPRLPFILHGFLPCPSLTWMEIYNIHIWSGELRAFGTAFLLLRLIVSLS